MRRAAWVIVGRSERECRSIVIDEHPRVGDSLACLDNDDR
jgi:hypothetical protein